MPYSKSTRVQRPRAWAVTGVYRELARRLPRCGGSRRCLLTLVERRGKGMGELAATREDAVAFASWRGPIGPMSRPGVALGMRNLTDKARPLDRKARLAN